MTFPAESSTAIRVLIVNKFVHLTGGADQHCLGLADGLRERGHEVQFLSTASERNVVDAGGFIRPTVTHWTRDDLRGLERADAARRSFWNADAARAMSGLLDSFEPDLVHGHKLYPQLSVAPLALASRRRLPIVQTLHDFELVSASSVDARGNWIDRDESRVSYRLLNSATLPVRRLVHTRLVDAFVSVSRFVTRVHRRHGVESTVIPNFVDPPLPADSLPPFEDRNGIVFLGRLRPEKGVLDVIELAGRLPETPVTVIGNGALAAEVAAAAATLPNLRPTGFIADEEVERIVKSSRVLVVPSLCQDAGPLVPLESMRLGTPVVAYANGGLAEYVVDSGGGRVTPADPVSLAGVCAELHEDAAAWARLSARGLEAVASRHSREGYIDRLLAVYAAARLARERR